MGMFMEGTDEGGLEKPKNRAFLHGSLRRAGSKSAGRGGIARLMMQIGGR